MVEILSVLLRKEKQKHHPIMELTLLWQSWTMVWPPKSHAVECHI